MVFVKYSCLFLRVKGHSSVLFVEAFFPLLIKGRDRFEKEALFATEGVLSTQRVEQTAIEKDHFFKKSLGFLP